MQGNQVVTAALSAMLVCACLLPAQAQLPRFAGSWQNIDPQSASLVRLRIEVVGSQVRLQGWGKCMPKDCDWGTIDGAAYAPSIRADPVRTARVVAGSFVTRERTTLLIIHLAGNGRLSVDLLATYTDQSGRSNVNDEIILQEAPTQG